MSAGPGGVMTPAAMPIARVTRETRDTFTLRFDLADRPGGLAFTPGQFNMLYVFGAGEVPISISGDPGRPHELVHTVRARYRQWLTHKLATWIDQFGTSGCVGCGRCITWCPVGIDLTEEAAAIRAADGAGAGTGRRGDA